MTAVPTSGDDRPRVAVLGAGPGGYPAAFLAAERGMDVTLIDVEPYPGGVCLYRGCIPSKALLHVAALLHETKAASQWGVDFGEPHVDLEQLRNWKGRVVNKLTRGLGALSRQRQVRYVQGRGRFQSASALHVVREDGGEETVEFDYAIVATGSRPTVIPALNIDSRRVMDSTSALELENVPRSLLVVGGGYIGLELGSVYAALGSEVSVVEMTGSLLPGADHDLVEVLANRLDGDFSEVLLETRVTQMEERDHGINVQLSGVDVGIAERMVEKVLVAVGRRPNAAGLGLEELGVEVNAQGFVVTDEQRRTVVPSIFAVGDVAGEPMLAHKATYEARVAVEAIAGEPTVFDPRGIPAVVFTDPELGWVGLTEAEGLRQNIEMEITRFPWAASGRATTLGRNDGMTKLIVDARSERVLGVGVVGAGAGELIAEATLALEMGATATDIGRTIHTHPTLGETVMESAELLFNTSPHYIGRRERAR